MKFYSYVIPRDFGFALIHILDIVFWRLILYIRKIINPRAVES